MIQMIQNPNQSHSQMNWTAIASKLDAWIQKCNLSTCSTSLVLPVRGLIVKQGT